MTQTSVTFSYDSRITFLSAGLFICYILSSGTSLWKSREGEDRGYMLTAELFGAVFKGSNFAKDEKLVVFFVVTFDKVHKFPENFLY